MFWHIFTYRLKCTVRDVQTLFWTLAFPVIMATLFGMAFVNLGSLDVFETVNIGVVNTDQYKADTALNSHMDSVTADSDDPLFHVTMYEDEASAKTALTESTIAGYILETDDIHLYIRSSGINQTIMKGFLDWYQQTLSSVENIIKDDPSAAMGISDILSENVTYIEDAETNTNKPNMTLAYYYGLIAMTCLYGAFMGVKEVSAIQANQSPQGARLGLAPVHKLKVFFSSLCSVTLVQYISILLLVGYLAFVIKVDFGNQLGYILLASFAGCCMGVSFGAFIGAVLKCGEGLKTGVVISLSMIMSYLSGLMSAQVKYQAVKSLPILAYINPGNLIADAFYSLYYYNTYERYFLNVILLFAFSVVFYLVVYFVMRRQQYESI